MSTWDSAAGRPAAKKTVRVSAVKELADGICELVLTYPERERPENAVPGQFVMIYPGDGSHILGRPISVCGYNPVEGALRLVLRGQVRVLFLQFVSAAKLAYNRSHI